MIKFDRKSLATLLPGLLCIAVIASFLPLIFTDPGGFPSAGLRVDVWAHGVGFLLGFLASMLLFHAHVFRKM